MDIPLYLNWTFWSMICAFLAIFLSQIPPVGMLLKKAKLDLEVYSRIMLAHKVGNPQIQSQVIISNVGGRSIRIKGISIELFRDKKLIATLPAQNYIQSHSEQNSLLFTPFSLKPNEEWSHVVNFLNYFDREDEKKYRAAESALRDEINRKLSERADADKKLVEADAKFVQPFIEMFKSKCIWSPGEYEMKFVMESIPDGLFKGKTYRFILYETDSEILAKHQDGYKHGAGIYFESSVYTNVILQISES